MNLYPNPLKGSEHMRSKVKVNIAVNSIDGRHTDVYRNVDQVYIPALSEGIYLIRITDLKGQFIAVEKLVVFP
jgi:hypothetical protein